MLDLGILRSVTAITGFDDCTLLGDASDDFGDNGGVGFKENIFYILEIIFHVHKCGDYHFLTFVSGESVKHCSSKVDL